MDQEYVYRVEAYLAGQLTKDEEMHFRSELEVNSELANVYHEYILASETIDRQEEIRLSKKFETWEQQKERTGKIKMFPILWKVAASFLFLLGFYYAYIETGQEFDTYAELAQSKYELPDTYGRTMGGKDELWQRGLDAYEAQEFETAVNSWSTISPPTSELQFLLAHAYYNVQQFESAGVLLRELSEQNSTYSSQAEWYLLLVYLMMDQVDLFDAQCDMILEMPNHPFADKALDLKEEVERLNSQR